MTEHHRVGTRGLDVIGAQLGAQVDLDLEFNFVSRIEDVLRFALGDDILDGKPKSLAATPAKPKKKRSTKKKASSPPAAPPA